MITVADKVQALIAEQIIGGKLSPGDRLDERLLAQEFNVSRTPVREALRKLAARGLTQILPMRGAVVMHIGIKELSELLNADCELEALCARLAAESMSTMEKIELQYVHQKAKELAEKNDLEGYLETNQEFHRLILEGAHNDVLYQLVAGVRDRLSPYRQYHPAETARLATASAAHDAIVDAIVTGDEEKAYREMRAHNARLGSAALRALRQAQESAAAQVSQPPKPAAPAKAAAKSPAPRKTAVKKVPAK